MIYPKKPLFAPQLAYDDLHTEQHYRSGKNVRYATAEQAGAKEVYLIHEPMAAALVSVSMWRNRLVI